MKTSNQTWSTQSWMQLRNEWSKHHQDVEPTKFGLNCVDDRYDIVCHPHSIPDLNSDAILNAHSIGLPSATTTYRGMQAPKGKGDMRSPGEIYINTIISRVRLKGQHTETIGKPTFSTTCKGRAHEYASVKKKNESDDDRIRLMVKYDLSPGTRVFPDFDNPDPVKTCFSRKKAPKRREVDIAILKNQQVTYSKLTRSDSGTFYVDAKVSPSTT